MCKMLLSIGMQADRATELHTLFYVYQVMLKKSQVIDNNVDIHRRPSKTKAYRN